MKTIDTKSALIGLLLGVLITLGIGAVSEPGAGRYRISAAGNTGLVIDTVTGEVWRSYFPNNNGVSDYDFPKRKLGEKK